MFHCPVGVWVIGQHAIILSATVHSPTVNRMQQLIVISIFMSRYIVFVTIFNINLLKWTVANSKKHLLVIS